MRCPECNTEILDPKSRHCPNCGSPVNINGNVNENSPLTSEKNENNEPKLGRGMMVFIVLGILFLIGFGAIHYMNHKDDPEYFRTAIDPDSNLADKNTVKFDTLVPDTAARDSMRKAEKREAEKILNSIRKKPVEETTESESTTSENTEASQEPSSTTPAETAPATSEPAPVAAPKPKIEQIENE